MTDNPTKLLVLGIGNPNCGDDAAGPDVVKRIEKVDTANIQARAIPGEAASIIAAMKGYNQVVLVDAILPANPTGALHVFDVSRSPLPVGLFGHFSTHSIGLAEAVELARALGELPPRVIALGIEGERFEPGDPMSPRVKEAVKEAARWILQRSDSYSLIERE